MKKLPIIIMLAALLALPATVFGFGKNKVQYRYMDWRYFKAPHYTLYFHQDQGTLPAISYYWLNEIYGDLSGRFGFVHGKNVPVVLYESPALFEQTNIITEVLPEEVGGFTEIFKNRIAVPFNSSYSDLRHVLHHEMVHAFVFGVMLSKGGIFGAAAAQVPLWFNEGLAEALSTGWTREADMFMLDRTLNSTVPPPGPMLGGYMAYKGGQSFMYYLHSTGGDSLFNRMLREFSKTRDAEKSIETAYKTKLDSLGKEWISELRRIYWPEIGRRIKPSSHAQAITVSAKDRSLFNLRPRISPDGKRIAFFSDRKDYTRIMISDTAGKIVRQIGQYSIGESFESFQPMSGAIAWAPDSRRLAFAAKKGGRSEIRIVDTQKRGKLIRTIKLELLSVNGMDWSRDGNRLALTGISGGKTDLYIYDLNTSQLTRLTNTVQSKNSPRFSPNGKNIIYTLTDTAGLTANPLSSPKPRPASNIAVFDIEADKSGLLTNNKWNDKQPSFAPDGKSFVFVSDRNGIDNLYIAALDNPENPRPLTDYAGNCGNPDWAADGSAIVYDLFSDQAWNIWRMEKPEEKVLEDSALVKTVWAEHEENPSKPFFRKMAGNETKRVNNAGATAPDRPPLDTKNTVDTANINTDNADINKDNAAADADTVNNVSDTAKVNADNAADTVTIDIDNNSVNINVVTDSAVVNNANDTANTKDTADVNTAAEAAIPKIAVKPHQDFMPVDGLPSPAPYSLRFSPDLVIFGLGVNSYSGASGQAIAMFSDIMGDHRIMLAGDLQINFTEYAQLFASYHYLKHRVNMMAGGFYYKDYSYDGRFRQFYHDLETGGILGFSYPFSMFSRADLQFKGSYIRRVPVFTNNTGTLESNALLSVFGLSYDNILWGITGPLNGIRGAARFHFSPPADFIEEAYAAADIDIRNYTHIFKKFVWANRITAGGSLALNGGSPARRFILGGNENWFNYDVNIEKYDENLPYSSYSSIAAPLRGWNYFDLAGDRMILMNSEFRFPFIKEVTTVWPLPMQMRYINGALFVDGGYAWTKDEQDGDLPIPPRMVGGLGFGMRANLGIFVLRYDRGWPVGHGSGGPINYFSLGAEF